MRPVPAFVVGLIVLLAACGGSGLTVDEYAELMQTRTDALEAQGEQFVLDLEAALDPETGAVVDGDVLQGMLDETAVALEVYFDELAQLDPPPGVAEAHDAFVAVAVPRLQQWQGAADRAAEIASREELATLVLKTSEFTETCMSLERAVDNAGSALDLDCD